MEPTPHQMIVAYGRYDRAIGQDGAMPWGMSLKGDLAHFRRLTLGKSIIMGRNTYESLGRPLPGRENIVVTRRKRLGKGVVAVKTLEEAYEQAQSTPIVIGGAALYAAALPFTDVVFATEVDGHFPDADVFFPELSEPEFIEALGSRQSHGPDQPGGYVYQTAIYVHHLSTIYRPETSA